MKSEFELLAALQRIEQALPAWIGAFDEAGLREVMHRHYDLLMVEAPRHLQDGLHDKLRALMVKAGVVQDRARSPEWRPQVTTAARRDQ